MEKRFLIHLPRGTFGNFQVQYAADKSLLQRIFICYCLFFAHSGSNTNEAAKIQLFSEFTEDSISSISSSKKVIKKADRSQPDWC